MLTKEGLNEIIKRRHDEGKTLSIGRIKDEVYTNWQIKGASERHYGGWAKARNSVVGVSKCGHNPELTREEVASELRRLQAEGHSMKTSDFDSRLYRDIQRTFGGYKQAKKELDIVPTRKKGSRPRPVEAIEASTKYSEDELIERVRNFSGKYEYLKEVYDREAKIISAVGRRYGSLSAFAKKHSIKLPPRKSRRYWTEERISQKMKLITPKYGTASNALRRNGYSGLVGAVNDLYGTWNAGLVALGYEVAYERGAQASKMSKKEFKTAVLHSLAQGTAPTSHALKGAVPGFGRTLYRDFEGMEDLKEYCGFCTLRDKPEIVALRKYIPDLQSVEGVQREIKRMWYVGMPLNYSYVRKNRKHILKSANSLIGSWKKAIESIGIDYDSVTKAYNVLSECGSEFEDVFANILTELNYEYIREGEGLDEVIDGFTLQPDFVLPNWRWIDCKLSEWSDVREMLIRYHAEKPNGITIVYLRGVNRKRDRGAKWKYEHISVYQFTKRLPDVKRRYYEDKLREIEIKAQEDTDAS